MLLSGLRPPETRLAIHVVVHEMKRFPRDGRTMSMRRSYRTGTSEVSAR